MLLLLCHFNLGVSLFIQLWILLANMNHMAFIHIEHHLPILVPIVEVVQHSLEPPLVLLSYHQLITLSVICKLLDKGPVNSAAV